MTQSEKRKILKVKSYSGGEHKDVRFLFELSTTRLPSDKQTLTEVRIAHLSFQLGKVLNNTELSDQQIPCTTYGFVIRRHPENNNPKID